MCHDFEIWIHSVVQLDKRDKGYKAQAHCLTYALTGLHEVFHPQPDGPLGVKMKCSVGGSRVTHQEQLGYSPRA